MRVASFFSGIGGLELGLERALDAETVFQCERDPYARQVLEQHWPGVPRHDDITTLRPEDIPHADVWCGGFPCQDISLAGKGEGLDGDRSGLWWTWFTLVLLVRPRVLVLENVAALRVRGLDDVLRCLAEAGFDAEWDTVGAWEVGAPHRRDRMFIIGVRRDADGEHEAAEPGARGGAVAEPGGDCVPDTERDQLRQQQGRQRRARGAAGEAQPGDDGAQGALADAEGIRCGQGRSWRATASGEVRAPEGGALADADGGRREGERECVLRRHEHTDRRHDPDGRGGPEHHCARVEPETCPEPVSDAGGSRLEVRQGPEGQRPHAAASGGRGRTTEPSVGRSADGLPARMDLPGWAPGWEDGIARTASGVAHRVDRLRCLGNAVVPVVAYVVGLRVRAMLEGVA